MPSHVRTLCRTYTVWREAKCHCQWSFSAELKFKNMFKALNTLLKSPGYTIRERVFLFPCIKILLGHSHRWTQCNHHEPSCGVRSSWKGRETTSVSETSTLDSSVGYPSEVFTTVHSKILFPICITSLQCWNYWTLMPTQVTVEWTSWAVFLCLVDPFQTLLDKR
jgi:hypothetical protein